jgi:hypothetical protein
MDLQKHLSRDSLVTSIESGSHLEIQPGSASTFRLAQLDDYSLKRRRDFPWSAPSTLSLRARASSQFHAGTWGFGLWNDPFSLLVGLGGMNRPLPILPNAAWFFFASPDSYLSFRNDKKPNGFLAGVFQSPCTNPIVAVPELTLFPLVVFPQFAKWLRNSVSLTVHEDSTGLDLDVTQWNDYLLRWTEDGVHFEINGNQVFQTTLSPSAPMGLVIWIDNQFAAFTPSGKIKAGTLESSAPAWLEIEELNIQ